MLLIVRRIPSGARGGVIGVVDSVEANSAKMMLVGARAPRRTPRRASGRNGGMR
jgi:hypothetical protein